MSAEYVSSRLASDVPSTHEVTEIDDSGDLDHLVEVDFAVVTDEEWDVDWEWLA